MKNELPQIFPSSNLDFPTSRKMVQIGLTNKEESLSESHLTNNNYISKAEPVSIYSNEIFIVLIILVILRVLEILVYGFTNYRRNLKKKIIKTVSSTANGGDA